MEPSHDLAPAGEFNGSESGWTTYIGSPIYNEIHNDDKQSVEIQEYENNYKNPHGNVNDDGDKGENIDHHSNKDTDDDKDSDDSMVSDASSGPSNLHLLSTNREERGHGFDYRGHNHEKILLAKKASKQVRKTGYKGMVKKEDDEEEEEEYSLLVTDSAASHVGGGAR